MNLRNFLSAASAHDTMHGLSIPSPPLRVSCSRLLNKGVALTDLLSEAEEALAVTLVVEVAAFTTAPEREKRTQLAPSLSLCVQQRRELGPFVTSGVSDARTSYEAAQKTPLTNPNACGAPELEPRQEKAAGSASKTHSRAPWRR